MPVDQVHFNKRLHAFLTKSKCSISRLQNETTRNSETNLYLTKYKFMQEVKEEDKPPFPSVPTYDAKWCAIMKNMLRKCLVLNVKKITIARLRSVNYKRPLDHIIDSFCYLLKRFQIKNSEFRYGVYNYGYDKAHRRIADDIPGIMILIIIPSENEFHYHIPNYIDPKNLEKSNTAIKEHFKDLKNKHIIILRSDREMMKTYIEIIHLEITLLKKYLY